MKKVLLALAAAIFSLSLAVYIAPLAGAPWDTPVAVAGPIGDDDPGEAIEEAKEAADAQAETDEKGADEVAEEAEAEAEEAAEAAEGCGLFSRCDPPGDSGENGLPPGP